MYYIHLGVWAEIKSRNSSNCLVENRRNNCLLLVEPVNSGLKEELAKLLESCMVWASILRTVSASSSAKHRKLVAGLCLRLNKTR